jgi:bifunctional non-homologous end joining protein LigD
MLAESVENPFSGPEWIFELKYDGFRLLAEKDGSRALLRYRHGTDATATFPEVAAAVAALPVDHVVLDGELVAFQANGHPSFSGLHERFGLKRRDAITEAIAKWPTTLVAFDCLALDGRDLRDLPLVERKRQLKNVLTAGHALRYVDHVDAEGVAFFSNVRAMALEGIVGKKRDSSYRGGRSKEWRKVRIDQADDFVVVGFSMPQGSREGIGGLDLAQFEGGRLSYAGSVGSGFDAEELRAIRTALDTVRRSQPAFSGEVPTDKPHVWVEPALVAEVRFKERREDGLRIPTFVRFRTDKKPVECVRATPAKASAHPRQARPSHRRR